MADIKTGIVQLTFSRWLSNELQTCLRLILDDVDSFQLQDDEDEVFWKLSKSKRFSVKSMYDAMTRNEHGHDHKRIWKGKTPQKIKIFMWLMANNAILTKDNLIKRKWCGNSKCVSCNQEESIDHLFFHLSHCQICLDYYC